MPKNLNATECVHCGNEVIIEEMPRRLTIREGRHFFNDCEDVLFSDAYCPICLAKYLAWMNGRTKSGYDLIPEVYGKPADLSYRSTFNDEPGIEDLPKYDVQVIITRIRIGLKE